VKAILDAVSASYQYVFGPRLLGVAVHGSAVAGDAFPGVSDVDFVVVLDSRLTLRDCESVAPQLDAIEIAPFAYVQVTYHESTAPMPSLVPDGFSLVHGDIDPGFLHTDESLRSSGEMWLEDLPRLVDQDMKDWSVAVARRPRQFRLILTRLKPTVRANLVSWGDDPIATYRNPWPTLVSRLQVHAPRRATELSSLLRQLGTGSPDLLDVGARALRLLHGFAVAGPVDQTDALPRTEHEMGRSVAVPRPFTIPSVHPDPARRRPEQTTHDRLAQTPLQRSESFNCFLDRHKRGSERRTVRVIRREFAGPRTRFADEGKPVRRALRRKKPNHGDDGRRAGNVETSLFFDFPNKAVCDALSLLKHSSG
jgi:nucleotidyltransferase-like protein